MRKFAVPFLVLALCALGVSADTSTPVSITTLGTPVSENFNSLALSGTSTATPVGWGFVESGTNANGTYTAGTGSSTTGDTYSFGAASSSERALGQLRSGSVISAIGAAFTNNSGSTITALEISYAGEQWRLGAVGRTIADRMAFQISVDASSLTTGTWTDVNALDFNPPVTTGTVGLLNGNTNRVLISSTISGLSIPNGATFFIRWSDVDATGADDGLAIDDFSLIATGSDAAPTVASTTPASSSSHVLVNSAITINFSEPVTAGPNAFSLACNSVAQGFSTSASPAAAFTLTPTANLPFSANCVVTVTASQIADTDESDPPDQMAADFVFSFDTESATDAAPSVVSTIPAEDATDVALDSSIVITFSEQVTASVNAFSLQCGAATIAFGQTSGASNTFVLDPDLNLPPQTLCNLFMSKAEVSDADSNDPPDNPLSDFSLSFTTQAAPATNIIINELDSDQNSTDTGEFIELYDGGVGNTSLSGLALVFYNGSNDQSYLALDLDGQHTDGNGYFVIGNPGVPGVGLTFPDNTLQNGQDAVALYVGNASAFPNGTLVKLSNLLDALVYDTDDADDPGLLALLNAGEPQVNEGGGGNALAHSVGRCGDTQIARNTSTYTTGLPSPGMANNCPPPPPPPSDSVIVISQIYGGGGSNNAPFKNDFVELYNRGDVTVDTTGWTLQYAAAAGSGWDFNKTPLGGPIAPGEYYLVKLASNADVGSDLPDANVSGLINMSGTQGKIAIVGSFESLVGNCPLSHPHLKDLVGYGSADCAEGSLTAPSPSATTALFRKNGGATDTDQNSADFDVPAAPTPRRTAPIVELPPMILATDPSSNGFNAPRDPTIAITFTEPVTVDDGWFDITCTVSGQHNSHTLSSDGRIYDITPNVNMTPSETCTVTIAKERIHDDDLDDEPGFDTLFGNSVWQFTVSSGTPPPYAPDVHLTFGNPTNAVNDTNVPDNFLMEKPEYALSYNRDLGRPNWVSWHLSTDWYGSLARVDTFRADPQVPPDWYRVQGFDFTGSGFDRGHMVPNADRDKETSIPINQATYLMTNMIAQAPGNNQGPWADMEIALRAIADQGNELYIVAGPAGMGGTGTQGFANTITNGHVTVPNSTWKAVLVLPKADGDDVSRVSCATRSIAVIMPNIDSIREDDWQDYLVSIDAVESLTGYDLFSNLPDEVEYCVEAGINGNNPPQDVTPPSIQCDAPDGAWHADNVTLACTAADVESGLANMGDASFTLSTLVPSNTEDGNAATDTRVVCDAVGNCATAGPIFGNRIDRLAPQIAIAAPLNGATYSLNAVVPAVFRCGDSGSGIATCDGTTAAGSAIDTASSGVHAFTVNAVDAVGNASSTTVSYSVTTGPAHKRTPSISIANIPTNAVKGSSFTPSFNYDGDGNVHLRTETPSVCTIKADRIVNFVGAGTCTISAWATASGSVNQAIGPLQSFQVAP